jgi:pimeloyl-ACP methyl ester carboxylesterase
MFSLSKFKLPSSNARGALSCLIVALLGVGCGSADGTATTATNADLKGKSFVLVHGAWNGAWVWKDVTTDLENRGALVSTVNLSAHGDDATSAADASLAGYVDEVTAAVDAAVAPVVLVGHSFGGTVVSQAAEQRRGKLDRVIYVGAFLPVDGESTLDLAQADAQSELGPLLQVDMDRGVAGIERSHFARTFCEDCDDAALMLLDANYRDEPLLPLLEKVALTDASFGSTRKFYVHTALDHVISPSLQDRMTARVALAGTATIESSHSPFLSVPSDLAATLGRLSKQ